MLRREHLRAPGESDGDEEAENERLAPCVEVIRLREVVGARCRSRFRRDWYSSEGYLDKEREDESCESQNDKEV